MSATATTAHPIENLVAVVDLEQKKIQKIEEGAVIPVPLTPRPYDGRDRIETPKKPLDIIEPEGKKLHHNRRQSALAELDFHPEPGLARGPDDLNRHV